MRTALCWRPRTDWVGGAPGRWGSQQARAPHGDTEGSLDRVGRLANVSGFSVPGPMSGPGTLRESTLCWDGIPTQEQVSPLQGRAQGSPSLAGGGARWLQGVAVRQGHGDSPATCLCQAQSLVLQCWGRAGIGRCQPLLGGEGQKARTQFVSNTAVAQSSPPQGTGSHEDQVSGFWLG